MVQSEWLAPSPLNRLTDDDDEWSDGIRRSSSLHRLLHHSTSLTSLSRQTLFCLLPITHTHTHTHTHTRLTALCRDCPGEPVQKGKTNLHFTEARDSEWQCGSGISWAICKSAPHSRQITTPAPHHSVFFTGRMPFLPPSQQRQSTEGTYHYLSLTALLLLKQCCGLSVCLSICPIPLHKNSAFRVLPLFYCVPRPYIMSPTHMYSSIAVHRLLRHSTSLSSLSRQTLSSLLVTWSVCLTAIYPGQPR